MTTRASRSLKADVLKADVRGLSRLLTLGALTLLCGCGEPMYSVQGRVVYDNDGQPMPRGIVVFTSEDGLTSGIGNIKADGTFTVMYHEPGDGLPGGTYTITFIPPDPTTLGPDEFKKARELNLGSNWGIPQELMSSETSDMTVAVDENLLDYEIRVKKASPSGKLVNPNDVIRAAADQP